MQRLKMVQVLDGPDTGFGNVNRRGIEIGCKVDQVRVGHLFNRPDPDCFQKGNYSACFFCTATYSANSGNLPPNKSANA